MGQGDIINPTTRSLKCWLVQKNQRKLVTMGKGLALVALGLFHYKNKLCKLWN